MLQNETTIKPTSATSSGELTLGSPSGNPGYSLKAPGYDPNSPTGYSGGGLTWVGGKNSDPAGDTTENRQSFYDWYVPGWDAKVGDDGKATFGNIGSTQQDPGSFTLTGLNGSTSPTSGQTSTPSPTTTQAAGTSTATAPQTTTTQTGGSGPNRLPLDTVQPYTSGNPELDKAAAGLIVKINSGEISFANLPDVQKQLVLQGLDQAYAADPTLWNNLQDETLRNAYISRFGNPQEGVKGAAQNSVNSEGKVQGQFQTETGGAYQAGELSDMDVERANAAFAAENGRDMTQEELSAWQMNQILAQDSPLMALARQDGVDMANRVGLRNSSLAAGASMREMARAATPLAMQDAQAYGQMQAQNQMLESDRLEQNAGRQQQTNLFNADAENAASSQEYAYEGNRQLTNAGMANDMQNSDRQRELQYNLQQLAGDQDFAKQSIANQTAVDLANIEGQYKAFISENDTAARLFDSAYQVMASIMGNNELDGDQANEQINYVMAYLNNQMELLLGFSQVNGGPTPPVAG